MELKRTDVAILVLLLFVQTLLKLTLLLETVLLSHLALLLLCLHNTAFPTEIAHLTVKHLIFAELTLQTAVEQGNLDAGFQTNLAEAFLTIGEYPSFVACKLVFQALTNHLVGAQQIGRRDAFSVRWVGHHDALFLGLREVLEVLFLDGDVADVPYSRP